MAEGTGASGSGWRARLRHAFAVEPDGPVEPEAHERELIEGVLRRIVARQMTGPATLFLEGWRPLGSITGQGMHMLTPFVGAIVDDACWQRLARYMQRRGSIPWMLERLVALERESAESSRGG